VRRGEDVADHLADGGLVLDDKDSCHVRRLQSPFGVVGVRPKESSCGEGGEARGACK
jgi:hypothetical protein